MSKNLIETAQDVDSIIRAAKVAALFGTGYLFARKKTRPMAVRIAARTGYAIVKSSIHLTYQVAKIWKQEASLYRAKPKPAKPPTKPAQPVQMVKDPKTGRWRVPPGGGGVMAFMIFGGILVNSIMIAVDEWIGDPFSEPEHVTTR
jgi:hypothetical protein